MIAEADSNVTQYIKQHDIERTKGYGELLWPKSLCCYCV